MRSYVTSYNALFSRRTNDAPAVERIEIPIIQRDYAQGREDLAVARIRENFLVVLRDALTGGPPLSLDFVYGDVEEGTLRPLDGQQRLTTLFLLHWYLAWRAQCFAQEEGWKRFSYATRASARLFCERLGGCTPPDDVNDLRVWIEDQHWFLHTWRHDPTIRAMVVMLSAISSRFAGADCAAAWARLVDPEMPAITFHLLPIERKGLSEDLYIKMNSRGKPLTPFENFKARFEQVLDRSIPDQVEDFALKVDGVWADILWSYRGSDDIVDDEFLRYFHFVSELCDWHDRCLSSGDIEALGERVYGRDNDNARVHLDFLFKCFDTWTNEDISVFSQTFTLSQLPLDSEDTSKVVLFGPQWGTGVNLFAACCANYGDMRGRNRVFSWPHTLFFYALLLHRIHTTQEFPRRLRVLRNLIEASGNELRLEKMPGLLTDVRLLIVEGTIEGITSFNQAQVADERLKADMLAKEPTLERHVFQLEDHPILRGCLTAFEIDVTVFERRARAFHDIFGDARLLPLLTGALLAAGDYSRSSNPRFFQLGSGSNEAPWRDLLTSGSHDHRDGTPSVLGRLLDAVAERSADVQTALAAFASDWVDGIDQSDGLEWRWYFVKYPAMREGRSGIYAGSNYDLCMLNKTQMNSSYRDPFLEAIRRESGVLSTEDQCFTGYETEPRWLRLTASESGIRCVQEGLLLRPPIAKQHAESFARVRVAHGIGDDCLLKVPQIDVRGRRLDIRDRVQLGATLLRNLVDAGL